MEKKTVKKETKTTKKPSASKQITKLINIYFCQFMIFSLGILSPYIVIGNCPIFSIKSYCLKIGIGIVMVITCIMVIIITISCVIITAGPSPGIVILVSIFSKRQQKAPLPAVTTVAFTPGV